MERLWCPRSNAQNRRKSVDKSSGAHLKAHQSVHSPFPSSPPLAQLIDMHLIIEIRRRERRSHLGSLWVLWEYISLALSISLFLNSLMCVCLHSILFQSLQIGTTKKNDHVIDIRAKKGVKKGSIFVQKDVRKKIVFFVDFDFRYDKMIKVWRWRFYLNFNIVQFSKWSSNKLFSPLQTFNNFIVSRKWKFIKKQIFFTFTFLGK